MTGYQKANFHFGLIDLVSNANRPTSKMEVSTEDACKQLVNFRSAVFS